MSKQIKTKTDADVVCPECYKPAATAAVLPAPKDRYNRPLRSYIGGCLNCEREFEVIQFKADENKRWSIHMCRFYDPADNMRPGPWRTMKLLPNPAAPVLVGPGGDFDREIKIDGIDFLERAHKALKSLTLSFANLLKAAKRSKETDDDQSPL